MAQTDPKADAVLNFWFKEIDQQMWFKKDPAFDATIAERFGGDVEEALSGGYHSWENNPDGRLALILLLDQFTRNLFRGTARAFSGDDRALSLTQRCVAEGDLEVLEDKFKRIFVLMPMMHSEELAVHDQSIALFEQFGDEKTLDYAHRHRNIIKDWGRYPHRNTVLGRDSTEAERAFLETPGSSF